MLCCTSAIDSHKVKLCPLGTAKKPGFFKGVEKTNLPLTYFSEAGVWKNHSIFKTWFD
jgi:hypothetical protein